MASRYCTRNIVSYFSGEESTIEDIIIDESDDLGMEDEIGIEKYNNLLEFGEQGKPVTHA